LLDDTRIIRIYGAAVKARKKGGKKPEETPAAPQLGMGCGIL
jgi:hypothetical protein